VGREKNINLINLSNSSFDLIAILGEKSSNVKEVRASITPDIQPSSIFGFIFDKELNISTKSNFCSNTLKIFKNLSVTIL
jgi:hypothetical protein